MFGGIDIKDVHIVLEQGAIRKLLAEPALPEVRRVTNDIYGRAMAIAPRYDGMYNDNYYHHAQIGRNGIARGDVECGNIVSMRKEKKYNYLLKSMR